MVACQRCGFTGSAGAVAAHARLHCNFCSTVSKTSGAALLHKKEHEEAGEKAQNKHFKCTAPDCDHVAVSKAKLDFHMTNMHGDKAELPTWACTVSGCTWTSTFPGALGRHTRQTHGGAAFVCRLPGCGLTVNTMRAIADHEHRHVAVWRPNTYGPPIASASGCAAGWSGVLPKHMPW